MAEAFIVRRGGGGSGGTLVITSSGAGTVTVSNSTLGKSYSKTVTAGGSVTFKGLKTGDWTVTLSNGTQTTTKTVTINADYSTSIAYFSATISITYPATSTCVVTNSSGQTVASDTNTGSSTKTWTATVGATGTYTVTATATDGSEKTKSTTVSITTDGQIESVTLSYATYIFKSGIGLSSGYYTSRLTENGDFSRKDYLVWAASSQLDYGNIFQFIPAIDMSKFNTISIELACTARYNTSGNYTPVLAATGKFRSDESIDTWPTLQKYAIAQGTYNTSRHVLSLDISSVSSSAYISFSATGLSGNIYNVWLE